VKDLAALLRHMNPRLHEGEWVFCAGLAPDAIATFHEEEGPSSVMERGKADALGLPYSYIAAWITLNVHSDLDAVGLLAAVCAAIAQANISCNVVSALRHDHLFVPYDRRDEVLSILDALSSADNVRDRATHG
jgi:uncharacterized protein